MRYSAILLIVSLACACGPTRYLVTVAYTTEDLVEAAKKANAEKLAPYEYWSAVQYLHMAQEKAAQADFELSLKYGQKAGEMARKALRLSRKETKDARLGAPLRGRMGASQRMGRERMGWGGSRPSHRSPTTGPATL